MSTSSTPSLTISLNNSQCVGLSSFYTWTPQTEMRRWEGKFGRTILSRTPPVDGGEDTWVPPL